MLDVGCLTELPYNELMSELNNLFLYLQVSSSVVLHLTLEKLKSAVCLPEEPYRLLEEPYRTPSV